MDLYAEQEAAFAHARTPNAGTIRFRVPHPASPSSPVAKTEESIQDCVDQILFRFQRDCLKYTGTLNPISKVWLFADEWRGWPREEVAVELENRMYRCIISEKPEPCLMFESKWIGF